MKPDVGAKENQKLLGGELKKPRNIQPILPSGPSGLTEP